MAGPGREPLRVAATLAVGALGALAFALAGLPLPFLLGPIFAVTLAGLAGFAGHVPPGLRSVVIGVLGVFVGAGFSAERLAGLVHWLPSALGLALYVPAAAALGYLWLRRRVGLRGRDAFFAAMPGGFAEMVLLADRMGADVRAVALVHAVRVFLIVTIAPAVAVSLGVRPPPRPLWGDVAAHELLYLALAGAAGAWIARRVRVPAWALLGPMAGSAVLHLAGITRAAPPRLLLAAAQLVLGASIGTRFRGLSPATFLRLLLSGLALTALMFALTGAFALAIAAATGLPVLQLVVAYIPGGVVEMATVALALDLDPAFVATHHLLRILLVVTLAPTTFVLWQRWANGRAVPSPQAASAAISGRGRNPDDDPPGDGGEDHGGGRDGRTDGRGSAGAGDGPARP